jgi:hypothetical protein
MFGQFPGAHRRGDSVDPEFLWKIDSQFDREISIAKQANVIFSSLVGDPLTKLTEASLIDAN